ncbi:MAG: efflux RND transporter periplasmic adaptor subunit [Chitinophagaceae bacterium]|nr:efflux RND transporter periplasmic adaptor subunit [Chitinophagaceae bacterium]MCA6452222.1 efflux RND transporter periplasmic adaptor subunit [Chitinophagaceae bacterium]MCA6457133.1 efflux RND transporter periplasmic adaptor subunit [Chitinophagaceae bacterium]MCA6458366.1 efflux RND transporter periplasmic adaptor subunit [Chitinophagaceae bacterium]MCA6466195.1 efflux RND transporter periplasmic adaptor subunit [Chitinophagaceae bacterium]
MKKYLLAAILPALFSCGKSDSSFDAQGVFESDEVIVSAEVSGKLLSFAVNEGDSLAKGQVVAYLDSAGYILQRAQLNATLSSIKEKTTDVSPQVTLLNNQIQVQQAQLKNLLFEKERIENLLKSDAATRKQLDDINFQIESMNKQIKVTQQQVNVQVANVNNQNKAVLSELDPVQKKIDQVEDLIGKARVLNPIGGTVLTTYAREGEMTAAGKPLYKIANVQELTLRMYITGDQLPLVRIGQQLKVFIDKGKSSYKEYAGTVSAIASKAEFTPKTIQTKEERANLVYAVKVLVKNDGDIKIGMYGEVRF